MRRNGGDLIVVEGEKIRVDDIVKNRIIEILVMERELEKELNKVIELIGMVEIVFLRLKRNRIDVDKGWKGWKEKMIERKEREMRVEIERRMIEIKKSDVIEVDGRKKIGRIVILRRRWRSCGRGILSEWRGILRKERRWRKRRGKNWKRKRRWKKGKRIEEREFENGFNMKLYN